MADLYERITQTHGSRPHLPAGALCQLIGELYRGRVDMAYADSFISAVSAAGLDAGEQQELQDLLDTVDGTDRLTEIWDVLYMADMGADGYDTGQDLRTRFGVPTR